MCRNERDANQALAQTAKIQRYPNLQPYAHLRGIKQPLRARALRRSWVTRNLPTLCRLIYVVGL